VEIGDAPLPPAQKRLIVLARDRNRVVITPTQMMESMIENHIPTRAEIFGGGHERHEDRAGRGAGAGIGVRASGDGNAVAVNRPGQP
jgi:Pyruvate kinase, barrel domain